MSEAVVDFEKQHLENYKKAVIEVLKNNSKTLVEEDIGSLIKKPPLDLMDDIKKKFLALAKKEKIILDTKKLERLLEEYREELVSKVKPLKENRVNKFKSLVENFDPDNKNSIIKFNKKDFNEFNKIEKKRLKKELDEVIEKNIVNNVNNVFTKNTNQDNKDKIKDEMEKYLNKNYKKQLIENIDFKVLVKDTTLINSVKEQGERYIFTKNNSYLLNKKQKKITKAR